MKINITKKQYEHLLTMTEMSSTVFGLLSDFVEEKDYKKISKEIDELQQYLVSFADEYGVDALQYNIGLRTIDDDDIEDKVAPVMDDFEDFILHDRLPNILAWRDFHNDHTEEEIEKMSEEHGGYLDVPLYEYEKKYWDEFEKYGFDRLVVDEDIKHDKN